MARPRKNRLDLPECVYFRHGAYYFVAGGKWRMLGRDYAKAMAAWAKLLNASDTKGEIQTVSDLLDRYLLEVVPSKAARTQKDNRVEIRFLRAFFGGMDVAAVTTANIASYFTHRKAKTRANREIALLSHAFNKAILWGLTTRNPCAVPGLRHSEKPRDRYVTDEEIKAFKEVAPEWLRTYIDLKLLVGLRKQDMLTLKWSDISESHILVPIKKVSRQHSKTLKIVITDEIAETLSRLSRSFSHLFVTRSGTPLSSSGLDSTWKRTMAKYRLSGLPPFTEHDLRGKVATDMNNLREAQLLLGHTTYNMTEQYVKARKEDVVQPHRRKK